MRHRGCHPGELQGLSCQGWLICLNGGRHDMLVCLCDRPPPCTDRACPCHHACVHPAGVAERQPWAHVARVCLYDGARFHGSAQELRPQRVQPGKRGTSTWRFDAGAPLLVRCPAELLQRAQVSGAGGTGGGGA